MAGSNADETFVILKGGPTVPAAAYLLFMSLVDRRGFQLTRDGDVLVVHPPSALTPADCAAIRQWKRHLLMLVDYNAREDLGAHPTDAAPAGVPRRTA